MSILREIWKYPLQLVDQQTISAPQDFKPLSVHVQDGNVCLWGMVTPKLPKHPLRVRIYGTGHPLTEDLRAFVGTAQLLGYAWHVFC